MVFGTRLPTPKAWKRIRKINRNRGATFQRKDRTLSNQYRRYGDRRVLHIKSLGEQKKFGGMKRTRRIMDAATIGRSASGFILSGEKKD